MKLFRNNKTKCIYCSIGLRILTGRGPVDHFTSMVEVMNVGQPKTNPAQAVMGGLEFWVSRIQV